jgi:hypothetical protein
MIKFLFSFFLNLAIAIVSKNTNCEMSIALSCTSDKFHIDGTKIDSAELEIIKINTL